MAKNGVFVFLKGCIFTKVEVAGLFRARFISIAKWEGNMSENALYRKIGMWVQPLPATRRPVWLQFADVW